MLPSSIFHDENSLTSQHHCRVQYFRAGIACLQIYAPQVSMDHDLTKMCCQVANEWGRWRNEFEYLAQSSRVSSVHSRCCSMSVCDVDLGALPTKVTAGFVLVVRMLVGKQG